MVLESKPYTNATYFNVHRVAHLLHPPREADAAHLFIRLGIARYHATFPTDVNKDYTSLAHCTCPSEPWVCNDEKSKYC